MSNLPPSRPVRLETLAGLARYGRALGGFDRNVKLFLTVTAFRGLVIASLGTIYNLYLYSLGYDARFIGIVTAVNSIATLLVSVPLGYVADRVGRRALLVAGGFVYPLGILALGLVTSTAGIVIFNFVFGTIAAAYWIGGIPLLFASTSPRERVQAFSINSFLLWGLGPVGAFLSGQVVETVAHALNVSASSSQALRYGMLFMAALAFVGSIPYPFLREPRVGVASSETPERARVTSLFVRLLVPDVILAFGIGGILAFTQLYFHLRFHLDPGPIGTVMASGGLIAGVGTLLVPLVARRWGNLRTTVRLQWMAVPLMAVLALAGQLALAIPVFWAVLTLRGMIDPVYTAFVQEQVPEAYRARLSGLYSVTYSIGFSLGPAVSGQLQQAGGFTPAFLVGTGFYLMGGTLLYAFFGRRPTRPAASAA